MSEAELYTLNIEGARLIFVTPSFRADKGSVLHKGIYNHEFASMLSAMIICGAGYAVIAFNYEVVVMHYLLLIFLFLVLFVALRKFIFRERVLELVVDRDTGTASITSPGFFTPDKENIPLDQIDTVEAGSVSIFPEDRDAAEFVQKISRQHGSAIPGLADEAEFVTLSLKLLNGTERLIYAQRLFDNEEAVLPLNELKRFISGE